MNTPPGSPLSSFEASHLSGNDSENRLATAAFIPTLWGQHVVILHWEGPLMSLREVKVGQNAAYTAVESAAGFQYDALPLRQQRVLPKW